MQVEHEICSRGGHGRSKSAPEMAPESSRGQRICQGPLKWTPNGPSHCPYLSPFPWPLTRLGVSTEPRSQILAVSRQILTFPDPQANLVVILLSEMACTGVPHIVQHIFCSTYTFWGHFKPSKVRWRHIAIGGKLSLLGGKLSLLWGKIITFWGQGFIGVIINNWGHDYNFLGACFY